MYLTQWFVSTYSSSRGSDTTISDGVVRRAASILAPLFLAAFFWILPPRKPPDKPPDEPSVSPSDNPSGGSGGNPSDDESLGSSSDDESLGSSCADKSIPLVELNDMDKVRPHSGTNVTTGVLLDFSSNCLRSLVAWSFGALTFAINAVLDTGSFGTCKGWHGPVQRMAWPRSFILKDLSLYLAGISK